MIKKVIFSLLILLSVCVFLKACIRADIPEAEENQITHDNFQQELSFNMEPAKTVSINGIELDVTKNTYDYRRN